MRARLSVLPDLYPVLIALLPLVNLYVVNVQILSIAEIMPYLLAVSVFMFILYRALYLVLKEKPLTSLITALMAGMIFYVPFPITWVVPDPRLRIGLLIVWIGLFVIPALLLRFLYARPLPRSFLSAFSSYLNYMIAVVLGIALFNLVINLSHLRPSASAEDAFQIGRSVNASISLSDKPDVFYIILDGYGRADTLLKYYNYDNGEFLRDLEQMGFYIANESVSNYSTTRFSLASSLNLDYLDRILQYSTDTSLGATEQFLDENRVMSLFHEFGYQIINFNAGIDFTDNLAAADINYNYGAFNEFLVVYLRTTILSFLPLSEDSDRERIIGTLRVLPNVAAQEELTFALVHVLAPHPPFWFNADGTFADMSRPGAYNMHAWVPIEGYRNHVTYLNHLVEEVIREILELSDAPPIIILQGDHGPASDWYAPSERMPILNAYYLPNDGSRYLYPSITPVNSFRLIFDLYFGKDYGLLPDHAYFSPPAAPFAFCQYEEGLDTQARVDQLKAFLEAHNYRLRVDQCEFEEILPYRDGLYEINFPGGVPERLADQVVHLQLPLWEQQDYIFRASVEHFISPHEQQVDVLVGEEHVSTIYIPSGKTDYSFTVPAAVIDDHPFLPLTLEHSSVVEHPGPKGFPISVSLKYYEIEWRPAE